MPGKSNNSKQKITNEDLLKASDSFLRSRYFSLRELAIFGISYEMLRELVNDGTLVATAKHRGVNLYRLSDLELAVEKLRETQEPAKNVRKKTRELPVYNDKKALLAQMRAQYL